MYGECDQLKNGDQINRLEESLYRGRVGRRAFIKMAIAAGLAPYSAEAMAQAGAAAAANQTYNNKNLKKSYDFIVIGCGSGGSVVAGRLAAESDADVLLLEAGGSDQVDNVRIPAMWPTNIGSERDWGYSANPSPDVNGRAVLLPMGKVIGGGSSVNATVWARGHKNDFDYWASESGDDGWNYQNVLKIYRRIEDWQGAADPERRGKGGRLWVAPAQNPNPIAPAMVSAAVSIGIPAFDDQNGVMMEGAGGVAIANLRIKDGRRRNLPADYLYSVLAKPNMTLLTGAEVTRLVMNGSKVTGVELVKDGAVQTVIAAKRVILCAGAINSPKILMLSGIGDPQDLGKHNIKTAVALPGVGRNFQDHVLLAGCIWEYNNPLPPANNLAEATFFWKSDSALDTPDLQPFQIEVPYTSEVTGKQFDVVPGAWSLAPGLVRPKSRGRVTLASINPTDKAKVDSAFLSHPDDVTALLRGIELCREIGNSTVMKEFVKREIMPGKLDKAAMTDFIRNAAGTYFHESCTCKMGRDENAVVDGKLQVRGVEGLSIADASVMPRVSTGNTMASTVVIGERMADFLLS
jgi:choline dehydrogenase